MAWEKVFDQENFTGGPLDDATLEAYEQMGTYKLVVSDDQNGNDGEYAQSVDMGDFVKFERIDGFEFTLCKPKAKHSIIYVTPTGVAIVT